MARPLIKSLILTAAFAVAAPAFADEWKTTVTSSKAGTDHFFSLRSGALGTYCGGDVEAGGISVAVRLKAGGTDVSRLGELVPPQLRDKSFDEQQAYFKSLPKEERHRLNDLSKQTMLKMQDGLADEFDDVILQATGKASAAEIEKRLVDGYKAFVERIEKERNITLSVDIALSGSCVKPALQI